MGFDVFFPCGKTKIGVMRLSSVNASRRGMLLKSAAKIGDFRLINKQKGVFLYNSVKKK